MKKSSGSLVMGYWEYGPVEDLHHRTRLWLSDIAFWKEEFAFLRKLIKNHFIYFTDAKRMKVTARLSEKISDMEGDLQTVESNVIEHEAHLRELLADRTEEREKQYRQEHRSIENMLDGFIDNCKTLKRNIFKEADEILKEEKMQRFISLSG